jgi:hypothetical protein
MIQTVNFDKTPEQVRRELESGLEEMSRHLAASQGHSQRGNSSLLHALFAAVLVLAGHAAYAFWVENPAVPLKPTQQGLGEKELRIVQSHIDRLEASANSISDVRSRIAPSMQIDAQLSTIKASASDLRTMLTPAPQPKSQN